MLLLIDNYDSFTYNLAHLFGELGVEVVVRRNDEITVDEVERLAPSQLVISPGPGPPGGRRRLGGGGAGVRGPRAGARRLPRPPGDRRGVRRRGRAGARARARQGDDRDATTAAGSSPGCRTSFAAGPLPLARGDLGPGLPRGLGDGGRRRGDGRAPPRAAGRRRPVPSRVGADARRARRSAQNFLEGAS